MLLLLFAVYLLSSGLHLIIVIHHRHGSSHGQNPALLLDCSFNVCRCDTASLQSNRYSNTPGQL